MADIAEGAKDLLEAAGVGTFAATSGWAIYLSKYPAAPNTVIAIYNSGGRAPNPKWALDYPSLNIQVRGAKNGYQAAVTKVQEVKDVLLGLDSQDINGDRWVSVTMPGEPAFLGYDDDNRPMFSLNFRLIIEPAVTALSNRQAL